MYTNASLKKHLLDIDNELNEKKAEIEKEIAYLKEMHEYQADMITKHERRLNKISGLLIDAGFDLRNINKRITESQLIN